MQAAGLLEWERVQVVDVDQRRSIRDLCDPRYSGKGEVQLNGAAAHLIHPGDKVIIMVYAFTYLLKNWHSTTNGRLRR
jgi:aspartate 1-decarboxylase